MGMGSQMGGPNQMCGPNPMGAPNHMGAPGQMGGPNQMGGSNDMGGPMGSPMGPPGRMSGMGGPPSGNQMGYGDTKGFAPMQLQQLRAQIMAYKFLARNQPIPDQIRAAVEGRRPFHPMSQPMQRPGAPPQRYPSQPGAPGAPPPQQSPGGEPGPRQPLPPLPQPQNLQAAMAMQHKQTRLAPVEKPVGIDPVEILQERENR